MPAAPCETDRAVLAADFDGAAVAACRPTRRGFVVRIEPEDEPINPSPWYAFQLTPKAAGTVQVEIDYGEARHRYRPKRSEDGEHWALLDEADVRLRRKDHAVRLDIALDGAPVMVAGQEIVDEADNDAFLENLAADGFHLIEIGASIEGRPIRALSTTPLSEAPKGDIVLLIGRQHPPEVTGALAMQSFLSTVFGDTELAKAFRTRFQVIAIPLLNPDGVAHGHWRHNLGGVDLNRDWGPFTQPETQAVLALLDAIDDSPQADLKLMLDFHSTKRNVFYTQAVEEETDPAGFTGAWLAAAGAWLGEAYPIDRAERHQSNLPTAKNYVFRRFGAPSITYELDDRADRDLIKRSAPIFAEEAMRTLLEGVE